MSPSGKGPVVAVRKIRLLVRGHGLYEPWLAQMWRYRRAKRRHPNSLLDSARMAMTDVMTASGRWPWGSL